MYEHGNRFRIWDQFAQKLNPFCSREAVKNVAPVILPPGRLRAATRPTRTGSLALAKTIVWLRSPPGRERGGGAADCHDHRHLLVHQIGRERRQSFVLGFGEAVFDPYVAAVRIAGFVQATVERNEDARPIASRQTAGNPITGGGGGGARAASGHAAAPPRSVMSSSRRFN